MVQSISPPFTPHYPWLQGEPLFAAELNAAIANASSANPPGTYSLYDFGGRSDGVTDDSAAMNAAIAAILARGTGGKLIIAAGRTLLASAISASIPAGKSLTIEGMGPLASELYFPNATDGLGFTLLCSGTAWGAVNLHAFTLTRGPTSPPIANTGLSVTADPSMAALYGGGRTSFRDMIIHGSMPGSNQWLNSMVLNSVSGASLDNVQIVGANATADQGDALLTINGQTSAGSYQQFAVSNNLVNCGLLGGSVGLLITGYVQGVFAVNTTIIGQYDSVRWNSTLGLVSEELSLSNVSLNAGHRCIYASNVDQMSITGCAALHYSACPAPDFAGIELNNSAFSAVVGNNVVGAETGTETGIIFSDCYVGNTCIGNATTNINGLGIWLKGSTTKVTVVGNNINGASAPPISQDTFGNTLLSNTWNGVANAITTAQPMVFQNAAGPAAHAARWFVGNDGSTESSTAGGNNFEIVGADNTGALLGAWMQINRATGFWSFGVGMPHNAANDAAAATAGVQIGGIYRNGSAMMVRVT